MAIAPKIRTITVINIIKLIISKIDKYSPTNRFIMSLKIFMNIIFNMMNYTHKTI
jgi:hypothetical protein